jgi:hypothetical protein
MRDRHAGAGPSPRVRRRSGLTGIGAALRRNLIAGALAGLGGAFAFATVHAILIVPIWTRSASGLISGALAGAAAGWAYTELGFDARAAQTRSTVGRVAAGAWFGAVLWIAVVPVTLADALLRALGLAPRYELLAVGVAVALALTGGALLGWRLVRSRRAAIAGAAATMLLTIAMAGPVPIGRSFRALAIFLAVLPVAAVGGATLGALSSWLERAGLFVAAQRDATPS